MIKYLLLLNLVGILGHYSVMAQGIVRGKVTDINGEELIGATVVQKSNPTNGSITDFDGNYSLNVFENTPQTIVVSFISYQTIEVQVSFNGNKVVIQNFEMTPASVQLDDVQIIARAERSKDAYMRTLKMKSVTSIDYISKETIAKTGDSYVDDAVKRVTGVSTVAGFITVRGLADRYVKTTVNGALIPTLDPLTNNIKLDIFPTSLIDNIVINKTQSSNLPGDWTGAYLSIETKDYPQKFMLNIKTSFGYTPQSTFKTIVTSEKGPTDWLGYDDGYRDINHTEYSKYRGGTDMYSELKALGYEDYLNSLGVNSSHYADGAYDNLYRKLALIELEELAPGNLDNEEAYSDALNNYNDWNGPYKSKAWVGINAPASEFGQSLANNWLTTIRKAPLAYSQDISIGNQVNFLGKPMGFIAGFRYSSSVKNDPSTLRDNINYVYSAEEFQYDGTTDRQITTETYAWSALLSASYKLNTNHSVSLLFMPNYKGTNSAVFDSLYVPNNDDYPYEFEHSQYYEERRQLIYQYHSSHYFPRYKTKADLNISYTDAQSSAPDFKSISYGVIADSPEGRYLFGNAINPERRWRYLDEDILDSRLSFEFPMFEKPALPRKLKFGASYQRNNREVEIYVYQIDFDKENTYTDDVAEEFNLTEFAIDTTDDRPSINMSYNRSDSPINFAIGYQKIYAGYLMLDYSIIPSLRISGGLRIEYTDLLSDIREYHEMGYPENDTNRIYPSGVYQLTGLDNLYLNPGRIEEINYLPSVNLVYKLISNERAALNARLNYSKTIARPSIREIAPYIAFDLELYNYVMGNPELRITRVDNYDFRLESYFSSGEFISVSLFYKKFKDHIEMIHRGPYSWNNAEEGEIYGLELEGKKKVFKNLSAGSNVTLVYSNTRVEIFSTAGNSEGFIDREMFGQAPYIVNGLLDYASTKLGIIAALSYNVQGPKIAVASRGANWPEIHELPRHMLDFKLSKSLGKHFNLEMKIRNILDEPVVWAYDIDDYKYIHESHSYGTSYIFSISYHL